MAITMDSEEQSLVRADSERVLGSGFWPITYCCNGLVLRNECFHVYTTYIMPLPRSRVH